MATTTYGDISPRTAAYAAKELLERAVPYMVFEHVAQAKPIPAKSSKTIKFRRYNALDATPNALTEGVTPTAKTLTKTDLEATLTQYGDLIALTDVIQDTHEDPVFQESFDILSEQSAEMLEIVRFNVFKAGTNVFYANGTARSAVNSVMTLSLQRKITRALKRQNARYITKKVASTPNFSTEPVAPAYIAICHPDCENDIRNMDGFVPVEKYGQTSPFPMEIGKVEETRYLSSTVIEPWASAGGDPGVNGVVSTNGTNADVYPILFFGANAVGVVPFKGKNVVVPTVVNPKPSAGDPLGQKGYVGWKALHTAIILNDAWLVRAEVAVSD